MKLVVLGCGTSTGVPRLSGEHGIDWGACDPNEPRNRRTRVAIMVESDEGKRILDIRFDPDEKLLVDADLEQALQPLKKGSLLRLRDVRAVEVAAGA